MFYKSKLQGEMNHKWQKKLFKSCRLSRPSTSLSKLCAFSLSKIKLAKSLVFVCNFTRLENAQAKDYSFNWLGKYEHDYMISCKHGKLIDKANNINWKFYNILCIIPFGCIQT